MPTDIRAFGSLGAVPCTITVADGPGQAAIDFACHRALWFDRDVDGTWLVWAADSLEGESVPPAVGAIAVRDTAVAAFLQALGHLLAFPGRFEHEPRFDGVLRWVRLLDRVTPVRPPPMATLLEDVPGRLVGQERTMSLGRDP